MWEWHFSVYCPRSYQALPLWSELTNNTAKTKMGYISLPSNMNAKIGIKWLLCNSENGDIAWCNENNSQWGFVFFYKKNKNLFLLKKNKKIRITKTKNRWAFFVLKTGFSQPRLSFNLFVIFPSSHDLEQVTSLSVCMLTEYRSLVSTNVRITGIWMHKN